MNRTLGWLLVAAAVLGFAVPASAQYAEPHITVMSLASQHHNSTFPNGKDSLSFWLETGAKQTASANYDTTTATDTLTVIPMSDNFGMHRFSTGVLATGDTLFLGRLVLNFDWVNGRILAATTDSVVVMTDVTFDGKSWYSANVSTGRTPTLGTGIASTNDANNMVLKSLWMLPSATVANGVPSTGTVCNCGGAVAIRFRLAMPSTLAKAKVKSASWVYPSIKPNPGPGAR